MSGPKTRTNPVLLLIAIVLCLVCGAAFTRSSAIPSPMDETQTPDILLADHSDSVQTDSTDNTDSIVEEPEETPAAAEPTVTPTPEPTPVPEENSTYEPSPEASIGVWTPNGSNWLFLVEGAAYKGWLYDTDEKVYYLNDSGIMVTGWQDIGDKRYYFNLDGVMQTGDVIYKEKTYHLLEDGSLKGYSVSAAAEKKAKKEAEAKESEKNEKESKKKSKDKTSDTSDKESSKKSKDKSSDTSDKESTKKSKDKSSDTSNKETAKASDEKKDSEIEKKTVAFTFDDGPSSFTNRLLDCLEENNVKATFFLVGYEIENFPEEVKRMYELGMEIGNHTADHEDLTILSAEDVNVQITTVNNQLEELIGQSASVLRPPYGAINETVTNNSGMPMILWSIDTLDWESKDPEAIADIVLSEIKDGSIILMHGIYSTTVDAMEILVPELLSQGYELVTVHELAKTFGVTLENGNTYSYMK